MNTENTFVSFCSKYATLNFFFLFMLLCVLLLLFSLFKIGGFYVSVQNCSMLRISIQLVCSCLLTNKYSSKWGERERERYGTARCNAVLAFTRLWMECVAPVRMLFYLWIGCQLIAFLFRFHIKGTHVNNEIDWLRNEQKTNCSANNEFHNADLLKMHC